MLRGELSNRPEALFAFDYRIFLEQKKSYEWFVKYVPELLLTKHFEGTMKKAFPWKPGARLWIESHWEKRVGVFTVGIPIAGRAVEMVVGDYVAECHHFDDRNEFRNWVRLSKHIARITTNDPMLLGIDDVIQRHTTWTED